MPEEVDIVTYMNHEGVPERTTRDLEANRFAAITLFRRNPHCFNAAGYGRLKLEDAIVPGDTRADRDPRKAVRQQLAALAHDTSAEGARPAFRFWLQRTEAVLGQADYFIAYSNGKSAARVGRGIEPRGVHRFAHPGQNLVPGPDPIGVRTHFDPAEACVLHYAHGGPRSVAAKLERLRTSTGTWWNVFPFYIQGREATDDERFAALYRVLSLDDEEEAQRQVASGLCFRFWSGMAATWEEALAPPDEEWD